MNSRRSLALMFWVLALILTVGISVFLGLYLWNAGTRTRITVEAPAKNAQFPAAAWTVAREFLLTAVSRKNLAESYSITHPALRGRRTLRQWKTGKIGVMYVPVAKIQKLNWKNADFVTPRRALTNVILTDVNGRPHYTQIGLQKVGRGSQTHWLVDYFQPLSPIIPPQPHSRPKRNREGRADKHRGGRTS